MLITRRVEFSASHRCAKPALSDEENRALYGEAANPRGHGHNYVVEVTLDGAPDPVTGMVYDLKSLKRVLNREVVEPMDHRFLNYEVPPPSFPIVRACLM
ncbi:MAG: 6-carboxytetrahydropterin synthase [Acidobacteria bacterium]|nr:6-carboxytetrahydropterin synthase [Acidobacteriota bacterium]